jgi:hypothetical protein
VKGKGNQLTIPTSAVSNALDASEMEMFQIRSLPFREQMENSKQTSEKRKNISVEEGFPYCT